ncbi:ArsR family transcriptional regulator [Natrialba chahannaoensis JCM 10990]|uniref:ArsR family transcriptional regulator n=1 Tax=Natrialba chahannaoensis JCM 10990 TaxID=1227492 RepID=M0AME3_9EURY|nr:metalloregulator ArsR/SmtB family transcription factor [Natrialba chahannaoensis]ELY99077.1 ArsR family transcriptional regulator [Natrialba chahannaoensis JCM 10990]
MTGNTSPPDDAYDALDRLYDNPDERVADLQQIKPSEQDVTGQVDVFKALGNTDRLRVLNALRESECCGCELQVILDAPQSTVATHLRKLKDAGLVKSRKKGKWSYYRIADTAVFELLDLANAVQEDD